MQQTTELAVWEIEQVREIVTRVVIFLHFHINYGDQPLNIVALTTMI